jgi:hypothetical protein
MKRTTIAVCLLLVLISGCGKNVVTPVPLAPGYTNNADQIMGDTLAAANGFYHTIQCETKSMNWSLATKTCVPDPRVTTPMVLTDSEKQAFDAFAASLNVANPTYTGFHAGTYTQVQAQAAIDQVKSQQNSIQSMIPQAVK